MALQYKLEYNTPSGPGDEAVYIQLRDDVPFYINQIGKEAYDQLDEEDQHGFITGLFAIDGVVEVSSRAFRVWVMKSPIYTWEEVNESILEYIQDFLGETSLEELPGSGRIDGTGFRLENENYRRGR